MNKQPTSSNSDPQPTGFTQHAMLVVWGLFAQKMGLIDALDSVCINQKVRVHTPQTKIIEFLVAMLAGLPHLQDISRASHPIDQDQVLAEAWGRSKWADYSGISRTLSQLREGEVDEIIRAVSACEASYLAREVDLSLTQNGYLMLDGDLTGRPVSSTSKSYPDAAFGYLGDTIALGYQSTLVSMHSPTYGRLWLANALHPGDTVSATQAQAMVLSAEARLGRRPRRRIELLVARLRSQKEIHVNLAQRKKASEIKLKAAQQQVIAVKATFEALAQQVAILSDEYGTRNQQIRPHCKLSRAKRQLETYTKRLPRSQKQLDAALRRYKRSTSQFEASCALLTELKTRLDQFEHDNATNSEPLKACFRLDAGFASADNIAWLIEMGYEIFTKSRSTSLQRQLIERSTKLTSQWNRVGQNASMIAWPESEIYTDLPYPLDLGLVRYQTGETHRHAVLLHYGAQEVTHDPDRWFHTYNGRQTIEAGIKEGKNVFQMHHFKVRSIHALRLQEHLAAFAANFVRFSACWLHSHQADHEVYTHSVKDMVRIGAHASAWVNRNKNEDVWLLTFTEQSIYAGRSLRFGTGHVQMPLFKHVYFQHF